MRKRIAYSQNFLKDKLLVAKLISKSSITREDIVYEIGAGQGIITEELAERAKRVVAFEIDQNLFNGLSQRFQNERNIELKQGDFVSYTLPSYPYKVFSNIPFNITSTIIRKLTQINNSPSDTYLIIQKEASKKFIGQPYDIKNSQTSILLKPWFELSIFYEFKRGDFFPKPNVDTVLLKIKKIDQPLIEDEKRAFYQDFVVYTFNQFQPNIFEGLTDIFGKGTLLSLSKQLSFSPKSKPSELDFKCWLGLFNYFSNKQVNKQGLVRGSFARLTEQQSKLEKIHRTRTDKNWKQFRKE